jgi:hypothetical protein
MTSQAQSQCAACEHFRSPFDSPETFDAPGPTCAAFPAGIPDAVYANRFDHRQPIDGDHGVRWAARAPGVEFPEYALATN